MESKSCLKHNHQGFEEDYCRGLVVMHPLNGNPPIGNLLGSAD